MRTRIFRTFGDLGHCEFWRYVVLAADEGGVPDASSIVAPAAVSKATSRPRREIS